MQPTTIASWAVIIWRALEARGVAAQPVFERAGVEAAHLQDPGTRIPIANMTRLWNLAVDTTGDPCFGLSAGQQIHPTTFHALGYAWLASHTLREALNRFVRFTRLVSTALTLRTVAVGAEVELIFEPVGNPASPTAATDAGVVALVMLCRSSYGVAFAPLRVQLRRPTLPCEQQFTTFMRSPIVYGAGVASVVFAAADLDRILPTGNAELARNADEVILKYLARFDRNDVVTQARMMLIELLPSGQVNAARVATELHLSVRSLQRKLAQHDTSVARLLDDVRRELASQYVRTSRLSVSEITYMLGFAEPASFTRAFRRWYGMSPSAWRQSTEDARASHAVDRVAG